MISSRLSFVLLGAAIAYTWSIGPQAALLSINDPSFGVLGLAQGKACRRVLSSKFA